MFQPSLLFSSDTPMMKCVYVIMYVLLVEQSKKVMMDCDEKMNLPIFKINPNNVFSSYFAPNMFLGPDSPKIEINLKFKKKIHLLPSSA